jgi:hypothetical protein
MAITRPAVLKLKLILLWSTQILRRIPDLTFLPETAMVNTGVLFTSSSQGKALYPASEVAEHFKLTNKRLNPSSPKSQKLEVQSINARKPNSKEPNLKWQDARDCGPEPQNFIQNGYITSASCKESHFKQKLPEPL